MKVDGGQIQSLLKGDAGHGIGIGIGMSSTTVAEEDVFVDVA
jgi:hypothetical protein